MKVFGVYLIVAVIMSIVCAVLEWPIIIVWLSLAVVFFVSIYQMVHVTALTKNLEQIKKFISKYKKDPIYTYLLSLSEGSKEEQRRALQHILDKYPQPKYQAAYGAALGVLNKDFDFAREKNAPIAIKEEGIYNGLLIDIAAGKKVANVPTFKRAWMNASVQAHIAYQQKNKALFEQHAQEALHASKGIQYYSNYYMLNQLREQL